MNHEHGAHTCYCPSCGFEQDVEAYIRCNSEICPICGHGLRAKETGEFRVSNAGNSPGEPPMGVVLFGMLALVAIGFGIIAKKAKPK